MPQKTLVLLVKGYRLLLSPWLGSSCRFEPTCSAYSLQALQQHGALKGSYLTLHRLARCHPWCHGGYDPVPSSAPRKAAGRFPLFTRLVTPVTSTSSKKKPS
ncbi:MAG: membrane protein insertion efficiency factor YidD [Polaromonas sp.]|nr:membrane protein insertion efficiency factor YidD [Polaromonas sp.]MDP1742247.1 membrane protein insertion efficiency factor YidD [Polaromonas sp.]MDP1952978.1 membrane protein insertion efficiency factor YidD [Polaromonas sp.]MDP3356717.1 membrane protein insertion efficiency factor YidD [Polaromonas sp.]MDP3751823.1 membrane protein insertion efficiency factor YidD [Polaromonas sp.]